MADPIFEFDPVSEDAANANLVVSTGNYAVTSFAAPMPQPDVLYASSVDTEGENPASVRFRNRTIALSVDVNVTTNWNPLRTLEQKVGKLIREKGTLKYTLPDGEVIIFDVLSVDSYDFPVDDQVLLAEWASVSLSLTCKPLGRGPEVDMGDNVETTLPWLVFTETAIKGTWPGLGRLVIDNDDASNDQWWVVWGIQSRYYSNASSAALAYQAEALTAAGGAAIAAGPSGASGAGSNVMRHTNLSAGFQAILSTQATGGGAHLSHIGTFNVFARVQVPTTNVGTVSVALEWGEGSFRSFSRNAAQTVDPVWEGQWMLVDLGLVTLSKVIAGTQRWEGRIVAKSTAPGDDIDIDFLLIVPVEEGSGQASAVMRLSSPATFNARDEFDQTAGALTGKTAAVGGVWAGTGDADDFTVDATNDLITRTAVSDSGAGGGYATGRIVTAGTAMTATVVQSDVKVSVVPGTGYFAGIVARYVDASNFLVFFWDPGATRLMIVKRVAGVDTQVGSILTDAVRYGLADTWRTMRIVILADGRFWAYHGPNEDTLGTPVFTGTDTALATAGALASGKGGIYNWSVGATARTGSWDNFAAWVPDLDAAVYRSQSIEVRHNLVRREDSAGALWEQPTRYVGDYMTVPPAGSEARTARVLVKASRGGPNAYPDSGIDDISARLFVTPRYLIVPEA